MASVNTALRAMQTHATLMSDAAASHDFTVDRSGRTGGSSLSDSSFSRKACCVVSCERDRHKGCELMICLCTNNAAMQMSTVRAKNRKALVRRLSAECVKAAFVMILIVAMIRAEKPNPV